MKLTPRITVGRAIAAFVAVGIVLGLFLYGPFSGSDATRITAYFTRTTGLYTGDDVRVLGVRVGTVTSIHPEGTTVRVELDIDRPNRIPRSAKAAIVAPSLVSGRFVQLAPAYVSGPAMASGSVIPQSRTAVPVEFDEVKHELTELAAALGPHGLTGKRGSLTDVINVAERNLGGGTASQLHASITAMSNAAEALASSRGDLFTTIKNLDAFVHNLVVNDSALRQFSGQLATFSQTLAANRGQLATALDALDQALQLVTQFAKTNTSRIGTSVTALTQLAQTLAGRSNALAQILQNGPFSADDFYQTIEHQAVNGRLSLDNLQGAAQLLCGAFLGTGGTAQNCSTAIGPLLKLLGISAIPGAPGSSQVNGSASNSAPKGNLLQTVTAALAGNAATHQSNPVSGLLGLLGLGGHR